MSATGTSKPGLILWTEPHRAAIAKRVIEMLDPAPQLLAVGGPRGSSVPELAKALDVPFDDDLRKLLVDYNAAYLLAATSQPIPAEDVLTAVAQDVTVLSLEPFAGQLDEWVSLESQVLGVIENPAPNAVGTRLVRMPIFTQSPGFLAATDPFELLGDQRVIGFESSGVHESASLFARLYDAWATVLRFIDVPETIDASLVGPLAELPEQLPFITGIMSAHARLSDQASVIIQVSDRSGCNHRMLHVIGAEAELRVTNTGYDLRHPAGDVIDHADDSGEVIEDAGLIAHQWERLLQQDADGAAGGGVVMSPSQADILACCLTCLLSARTGQPESPRRVIEMG